MGNIYKQNFTEGLSGHTTFEPGNESTKGDKEFTVFKTGVDVERNGKHKRREGLFVRKVGDIKFLQYNVGEAGSKTTEINESLTTESYEKMRALSKINSHQKKGEHKFNLPGTIRLVREEDGSHSILLTDLTFGGKKEMVDLKYFFERSFDQETAELICQQILGDLELAEQHNIALNSWTNENFPLDTWYLIVDKETGQKKVMIVDVGKRVRLNASKTYLEKTRELIVNALEILKSKVK